MKRKELISLRLAEEESSMIRELINKGHARNKSDAIRISIKKLYEEKI